MRETTRTALLHAIAHLPTPDRLAALADWEERAAIMQWDGGMSYAEADERAAAGRRALEEAMGRRP